MGTLGLTSIATIKSEGIVDSSCIRVFDIAIGDTSVAAFNVRLFTGISSSAINIPYIFLNSSTPYFHSAAGIRFSDGCWCRSTGCTASVLYIREF